MFDGLHIRYGVAPGDGYILNLGLWNVLVNEKTGERVDSNKTGKHKNFDLKLSTGIYDSYSLSIRGSLHKYFTGTNNAGVFAFQEVCKASKNICKYLRLDNRFALLHGLEIGVNIELPYSPSKVIKNAVCYKGKPFVPMDKKNTSMGLCCHLSQYDLKMYDKGKQSKLKEKNILRFEIKVSKMQLLKSYGISVLSDLSDREKAYSLKSLLLDAWDSIIWTDGTADFEAMKPREKLQWKTYSNSREWLSYDRKKAYKQKQRLSFLFLRYGKFHAGNEVRPLLVRSWSVLFSDSKAQKEGTFLPLEYTVKTSPVINGKDCVKRVCLSCGRDIANQKPGSVFCSAKYVGVRSSKRCRNMDSNRRKSIVQKINKVMDKKTLLKITYSDGKGSVYTDTLAPSECKGAPREWIDRIISIVEVDYSGCVIKEYIKDAGLRTWLY